MHSRHVHPGPAEISDRPAACAAGEVPRATARGQHAARAACAQGGAGA